MDLRWTGFQAKLLTCLLISRSCHTNPTGPTFPVNHLKITYGLAQTGPASLEPRTESCSESQTQDPQTQDAKSVAYTPSMPRRRQTALSGASLSSWVCFSGICLPSGDALLKKRCDWKIVLPNEPWTHFRSVSQPARSSLNFLPVLLSPECQPEILLLPELFVVT